MSLSRRSVTLRKAQRPVVRVRPRLLPAASREAKGPGQRPFLPALRVQRASSLLLPMAAGPRARRGAGTAGTAGRGWLASATRSARPSGGIRAAGQRLTRRTCRLCSGRCGRIGVVRRAVQAPRPGHGVVRQRPSKKSLARRLGTVPVRPHLSSGRPNLTAGGECGAGASARQREGELNRDRPARRRL